MADVLTVGIAEWKLAEKPKHLRSSGLGSCVGVIIYCPMSGVAAMAHVMLPSHHLAKAQFHPAKFADTAVPGLVEMLKNRGIAVSEMKAKMAGGAEMFPGVQSQKPSIGMRNTQVIKEILEGYGIPILGEDTGGHAGRTIEFYTETGDLYIRTVKCGERII
ncbi:MAG: chemotaxis protein CheD [Tuberibacillus sp.]